MSKISLTGNASGSGSVILQAPNSSTNRTLTVSEASGNIAISDGSTLTVDYASNRTTIGGKADFYGASTVKLDKWNIIGANTTLSVGQNYFANTRAQANLQLTLPSSANIGDTIMVQDQEGFASSNNVVVLRNGHNIDGVERNAVLTVDNSGVSLVYESSRNGWVTVKHASKDLRVFPGTVSGYVSGGGDPKVNTIQKFPFAVDTNASDVGDLLTLVGVGGGQVSDESGYHSGGSPGALNVIQKFPFAVDSNASDVGDLTVGRSSCSGQSSSTHGYTSGGSDESPSPDRRNEIDKFPFAVDTNASDVGDVASEIQQMAGASSTSHGYMMGGYDPAGVRGVMRKFPFAVDTGTTDVADLATGRRLLAGQSSLTHGYASGGLSPPFRNQIEKFPFATDETAVDHGDLTESKHSLSGQSSTENGYASGGFTPGSVNTIDKFSFASNANATDIGSLTATLRDTTGQHH